MKVENSFKQIIKLALPLSISIIIPQLNFLANTAFIARVGGKELGVNGIVGVFYMILAMVGLGLASGLQVQMSRRSGEGDRLGLIKIFSHGVLMTIGLSLILMFLCLWLGPFTLSYSLHDVENINLSISFIYLRVWGLPFLMMTQLINAYFVATGKTKMLVLGALTSTSLNVIFDYLFIFGSPLTPNLGLNGAAIASVIAEIGGFATMFTLLLRFKSEPFMNYINRYKINLGEMRQSLVVASPLIIQYLFSIGGWQLFFIWVEHLGTMELAASQIMRSVIGIVSIGSWALANTCNMMVSNVLGQHKPQQVVPIIKKVVKVSVTYALIVCSLLLLFGPQFMSLYTNDQTLIDFAQPTMKVVVLAAIIMSASTVVFNGVVGTGNTQINLLMEVTIVSLYVVYCYFIIEKNRMSLPWAWGADFVYWTALLFASVAYLKFGHWQKKKV